MFLCVNGKRVEIIGDDEDEDVEQLADDFEDNDFDAIIPIDMKHRYRSNGGISEEKAGSIKRDWDAGWKALRWLKKDNAYGKDAHTPPPSPKKRRKLD
jgi:hypothetical protein